jgi:hypothetical protein
MKASDIYSIGDKFVFTPNPENHKTYWAKQAVDFQKKNGGYLTVLSFDMMDTCPDDEIIDEAKELNKSSDFVIADIGLSPKNCAFHVLWIDHWRRNDRNS